MTAVDVDRLMAVPDATHPNLAAALVAALADLTVIEKGRTAKIVTKEKGTYSYDFADIADVVRLTRPVLAAHGVVALTPVHEHGSGLACTVVLLHTSGERLDFGPFPFPHGQTAQATGSAVTYHRRYALVAALGMAAGDDDDGAAAQPRQANPVPQVEPINYASTAQIRALVKQAEGVEQDGKPVLWTRPENANAGGDGAFVRLYDRTLVEVVNGEKRVAITAEDAEGLRVRLSQPSAPLAEKVAALPVHDDEEPF